jgi:hypothetical protein
MEMTIVFKNKFWIFFIIIIMLGFYISPDISAEKRDSVMSAAEKEADAKIRAIWAAMREALSAGRIDEALKYFSPLSKEKYRQIFTILIDERSDITNELKEIELIKIDEGMAEYNVQRNEVIDGKTLRMNYAIYFVRDESGTWFIENF